jgi:putative hydrolase of the HAD superfamily
VKTLFCDIGGCFLTNAWDRGERRSACETFALDFDAFEGLHEAAVDLFERGGLTLDEYLDRTVFAVASPKTVSREAFAAFMRSCSRPLGRALDVLSDFRASHPIRCFVLNNESREMNDYRIETFGLRDRFDGFLSSCYLGLRKPEPEIYRLALEIAGARPAESLMIDDRAPNLEPASSLGMRTLLFETPRGLDEGLRAWI